MKQITLNVLLLGILSFLLGCELTGNEGIYDNSSQVEENPLLQQSKPFEHGSSEMKRRFDSAPEEDAEAGNVVVWTQRYEELSVKNNALREKNSEMLTENMELKQRAKELEKDLNETRIELSEANEFLQQMHVELTEWKKNVLGYRDEMRQAQKAQLEALAKILRVLGAEPMTTPENMK